MKNTNIAVVLPGEILQELYLAPLDMSAGKLAKALDVPRTRIERLVKGQTAMTTDTALRLAKFFSTTPLYWMNMQTQYDLATDGEKLDLSTVKTLEVAA